MKKLSNFASGNGSPSRSVRSVSAASTEKPGSAGSSRSRTLTDEEYQRLYDATGARYRPVLSLLWALGARESEVIGLRWSCVDFQRSALTFHETKTEPRTIPMPAEVESLLAGIPRREGDDRVFDFTPNTFKSHVRKKLRDLGMADVWIHDIRRTFVTRKQNEGWSYKQIMLITGHRDLRTFDRYNKPSFEDLRAVVGGRKTG